MRKPRHELPTEERAKLVSDLTLRDTLATKTLMRKYDVSRDVIARIRTEIRRNRQSDGCEVDTMSVHAHTLRG